MNKLFSFSVTLFFKKSYIKREQYLNFNYKLSLVSLFSPNLFIDEIYCSYHCMTQHISNRPNFFKALPLFFPRLLHVIVTKVSTKGKRFRNKLCL